MITFASMPDFCTEAEVAVANDLSSLASYHLDIVRPLFAFHSSPTSF